MRPCRRLKKLRALSGWSEGGRTDTFPFDCKISVWQRNASIPSGRYARQWALRAFEDNAVLAGVFHFLFCFTCVGPSNWRRFGSFLFSASLHLCLRFSALLFPVAVASLAFCFVCLSPPCLILIKVTTALTYGIGEVKSSQFFTAPKRFCLARFHTLPMLLMAVVFLHVFQLSVDALSPRVNSIYSCESSAHVQSFVGFQELKSTSSTVYAGQPDPCNAHVGFRPFARSFWGERWKLQTSRVQKGPFATAWCTCGFSLQPALLSCTCCKFCLGHAMYK